MEYVPGDSIGIRCSNDPSVVAYIIEHLGLTGTDPFCLSENHEIHSMSDDDRDDFLYLLEHIPDDCTIFEGLSYFVDLTHSLSPHFVELLADFTSDPSEREDIRKLGQSNCTDDSSTSLVSILFRFRSCRPSLDCLVEHMHPLQPRYFSCASTPLKTHAAATSEEGTCCGSVPCGRRPNHAHSTVEIAVAVKAH
eukprot:955663_1